MTDEKKSEGSGNKDKSGKRRYFRRRNKNKKTDGSAEQKQTENAPAKPASRSGSAPDRKGPPPNKKRRSRRRRSTRRGNQPGDTSAELSRDPEPTYEDPVSVFVYTHVIRPAYRDMVSDYRPESSFLEDGEHDSSTFNATSLLTPEIRDQIAQLFRIGDDLPSDKPAKSATADWSDEDWDNDWNDWENEAEE
jgi:hypothetical protein